MSVTSIELTSDGEEYIVDKLDDTTSALPNDIGYGTGSTAAAKGDTALGSEVETRETATLSQVGTNGDTLQAQATHTFSGAQSLREAGLFDAATSGTLIVRAVYDLITVGSSDQVQFTFQLEFS